MLSLLHIDRDFWMAHLGILQAADKRHIQDDAAAAAMEPFFFISIISNMGLYTMKKIRFESKLLAYPKGETKWRRATQSEHEIYFIDSFYWINHIYPVWRPCQRIYIQDSLPCDSMCCLLHMLPSCVCAVIKKRVLGMLAQRFTNG